MGSLKQAGALFILERARMIEILCSGLEDQTLLQLTARVVCFVSLAEDN